MLRLADAVLALLLFVLPVSAIVAAQNNIRKTLEPVISADLLEIIANAPARLGPMVHGAMGLEPLPLTPVGWQWFFFWVATVSWFGVKLTGVNDELHEFLSPPTPTPKIAAVTDGTPSAELAPVTAKLVPAVAQRDDFEHQLAPLLVPPRIELPDPTDARFWVQPSKDRQRAAVLKNSHVSRQVAEDHLARLKAASAASDELLRMAENNSRLGQIPGQRELEEIRRQDELEKLACAKTLRQQQQDDAQLRRQQEREDREDSRARAAVQARVAAYQAERDIAQLTLERNEILNPPQPPPPKSDQERRQDEVKRYVDKILALVESELELKKKGEALKTLHPEYTELIQRRISDRIHELLDKA